MTTATDRTAVLAERLFSDTLGALELDSIFLGVELGLYRTLETRGPSVPAQLAEHAGIAPRYAREWLEQQAVAGLLDVEDPAAAADARRYALAPDQARVLAHPDDAAHVAPFAHMLAGIGGVLPASSRPTAPAAASPTPTTAGRSATARGTSTATAFTHQLPADWLAAMPDVLARRLEAARHPRVADVGCGQGFSTVAVANAFLDAHVDGFDVDEGSIADARAHAADAGLDGRVHFVCADAASVATHGPYDLVVLLEALHDMTDPTAALRAARAAVRAGGAVLVVDERVADAFTAPGDPVERMMYGWSVTHCLPTQLAEQPSAAPGTVMHAGTVHRLAEQAGYARVEVLPVENDFFRLYRLHP